MLKIVDVINLKPQFVLTDEQRVDGLLGDLHLIGLVLGRRLHADSACAGLGAQDSGFDQLRAVVHFAPIAIG